MHRGASTRWWQRSSLALACLVLASALPVILPGGQHLAPPTVLALTGQGGPATNGKPIALSPVALPAPPGLEIPQGTGIWSLIYWSRGLRCQAYLAVPPGHGPFPLLLDLHGGFPLGLPYHDAQVFSSAVEAASDLSLGGVAFLPNYAGYGPSQGPVGDTKDDVVDTLNGLRALRHIRGLPLRADATYLLGSSLGGGIALMVAERDQAARAAVLISSWPGAIVAWDWLSAAFPHLSQDDLTEYAALVGAHGDDVDSAWYRANSPNFTRIEIPILLIGGTSDPIVAPGMLRTLYGALKRQDHAVSLRFFPGGHGPRSSKVTMSVLDFFAAHGLPARY